MLLGLLMSPSPVSVRSATCSPSTVWTPPASASCTWGPGEVGEQNGGLSAELGLVAGLSGWSRGQGASLPLLLTDVLLEPLAAAEQGRAGAAAPGGNRRNSGRTRSSFLSNPRWSSALLL